MRAGWLVELAPGTVPVNEDGTPHSLKIWPSPRPSARSSSAIMCRMLGRARPFLQRLIVWGWTPRRRFSSAHDRPDASLKRSRRSGKSSGKA